jgi:hypothetical protein
MEAVLSSEISVNFHWTPWYRIPENNSLHSVTYTATLVIKDLKIQDKETDSVGEEYI